VQKNQSQPLGKSPEPLVRAENRLCYFLCYFHGSSEQSNVDRRKVDFIQCLRVFVKMLSDGKKWSESAQFQILSPVRLPFRHTGGCLKR
jgi:hypothetical protein